MPPPVFPRRSTIKRVESLRWAMAISNILARSIPTAPGNMVTFSQPTPSGSCEHKTASVRSPDDFSTLATERSGCLRYVCHPVFGLHIGSPRQRGKLAVRVASIPCFGLEEECRRGADLPRALVRLHERPETSSALLHRICTA